MWANEMYPGEDGPLGWSLGLRGLLIASWNTAIGHFIYNVSISRRKKLLARPLPIFSSSSSSSFSFLLPPFCHLSHMERNLLIWTESHILYDFIYVKCPEKENPQKQSRLGVARSGQWEWGLTVNVQVGSHWHDENVLRTECGDGHTTQAIC